MDYKKILQGVELSDFADDDIKNYISRLSKINVDSTYYLLLLVGPYQKGKKIFLSQLSDELNEKISHIDLGNVVSIDESETIKNIDSLFSNLTEKRKILFFSNADRLCGAYIGYTYSSKRYATPQERYLLAKLKEIEKVIIFDIQDPYNADATMRRYAHHAVIFDRPKSLFSKLTWKLGSVTFHGHEFETERPV
jgi:hypothetical protein